VQNFAVSPLFKLLLSLSFYLQKSKWSEWTTPAKPHSLSIAHHHKRQHKRFRHHRLIRSKCWKRGKLKWNLSGNHCGLKISTSHKFQIFNSDAPNPSWLSGNEVQIKWTTVDALRIFFLPDLNFAPSSPRHHFFAYPLSFSLLHDDKRTNERTKVFPSHVMPIRCLPLLTFCLLHGSSFFWR
jgi:hypothetical protein